MPKETPSSKPSELAVPAAPVEVSVEVSVEVPSEKPARRFKNVCPHKLRRNTKFGEPQILQGEVFSETEVTGQNIEFWLKTRAIEEER